MRIFATALLTIGVLSLVPAGAVAHSPGASARKPPVRGMPRILYSSDWGGPWEIYAVDPSGKLRTGQITFGTGQITSAPSWGFGDPIPSPDGSRLLFSDGGCGRTRQSLFIARADGSRRQLLAQSLGVCGDSIAAVWSPDSTRVAYAVDGLVRLVRADGSGRRIVGRGFDPAWSSTGSLAYLAGDRNHPLANRLIVVDPSGSQHVIAPAYGFAWSKDGSWIAYRFRVNDSQSLSVVRADGSRKRRIATSEYLGDPFWSTDGRFIGYEAARSLGPTARLTFGVGTVDLATGRVQVLDGYLDVVGWSPAGHTLAVRGTTGGLSIVDPQTSTSRLLTPDRVEGDGGWAPDGHSILYFTGYDLKSVSLAGVVRTIVSGAGDYGGDIGGVVWARPPWGTRYSPPAPRTVATLSAGELTAPWPITRIAADGDHVAYVSCGHVFTWTPQANAVSQTEPTASLAPACTLDPAYHISYEIYSLALAGDRIALGTHDGNNVQGWRLYTGTVSPPGGFAILDGRIRSTCFAGSDGLGELTGSGSLLVYSTWHGCPTLASEQQIERVDPGCRSPDRPCPTVADSPAGPLVPFDVNEGRIVAGGNNATVLLDANGKQLLSVPVSPLAAQLSGSDLIVLVRGELRDYDTATGTSLHAWPLPDAPSGVECGSSECYGPQPQPRLLLEDAAHGLVTYVLDGQVHLLRLSDDKDVVVAAGTLARFMDAGLVYADGNRLHLLPYSTLPLA